MVTYAGKMVLQSDGSYRGRTRAMLEVPNGSHRTLGDAVYFGPHSPKQVTQIMFISSCGKRWFELNAHFFGGRKLRGLTTDLLKRPAQAG